eukprot:363061-Chlamydomonas_euryale.AAC.2
MMVLSPGREGREGREAKRAVRGQCAACFLRLAPARAAPAPCRRTDRRVTGGAVARQSANTLSAVSPRKAPPLDRVTGRASIDRDPASAAVAAAARAAKCFSNIRTSQPRLPDVAGKRSAARCLQPARPCHVVCMQGRAGCRQGRGGAGKVVPVARKVVPAAGKSGCSAPHPCAPTHNQ